MASMVANLSPDAVYGFYGACLLAPTLHMASMVANLSPDAVYGFYGTHLLALTLWCLAP